MLVVAIRCNTLGGAHQFGFWNRGAVVEQNEQLLAYTLMRGSSQAGKDGNSSIREHWKEKRERLAPEEGL